MEDDKTSQEGGSIDKNTAFLPLHYIARLKAEDPTLEKRIAKLCEGEEIDNDWSVDTSTTSPFRVSIIVAASKSHLLDWMIVVGLDEGFPITMVRDALGALSRAYWNFQVNWYPDDTVNKRTHVLFEDVGVFAARMDRRDSKNASKHLSPSAIGTSRLDRSGAPKGGFHCPSHYFMQRK